MPPIDPHGASFLSGEQGGDIKGIGVKRRNNFSEVLWLRRKTKAVSFGDMNEFLLSQNQCSTSCEEFAKDQATPG